MNFGEYVRALWIEFSKSFEEDPRFYFMPWNQVGHEYNDFWYH